MFLGYLIFILPVVVLITLLCYLPFYLYSRKKNGKRPFIRHLTVYAWIGAVLSVLAITIFLGGFTFPVEYHFLNLIPFIWVKETYAMGFSKMIEQLLINIVMLVPIGLFLPAVFSSMRKWWKTTGVIAIFILLIETVQYFIGRSADIDDLIMNTFGGLIGYGIFAVMDHFLKQKKWWKNATGR